MNSETKKGYSDGCDALDRRDYAKAAVAFTQAIAAEPANPLPLCGAALAACRTGHFKESESLYRRAVTAAKETFGADHPHVATVAFGLVDLYRNQGRYPEAKELCRELLAAGESQSFTSVRTRVLIRLGQLHRQAGDYKKAETVYIGAIEDCKSIFGPRHPRVMEILALLADLYRSTGRGIEASKIMQHAISLSDPQGQPGASASNIRRRPVLVGIDGGKTT